MPLTRRRVRSAHNYPAGGLTTLAADTFDRTSPGAVGTASDGGTWAGFTTFFACNGTQLTSATAAAYITRDVGVSNYTVTVRIVDAVGASASLRWRMTDDNNYYSLHFSDPTHFVLWKIVAGAPAFVAGMPDILIANGDVVTITVAGTTHTVKVNGVTVATFTDPDLPTGTKCGPEALSTLAGTAVWDNFLVTT